MPSDEVNPAHAWDPQEAMAKNHRFGFGGLAAIPLGHDAAMEHGKITTRGLGDQHNLESKISRDDTHSAEVPHWLDRRQDQSPLDRYNGHLGTEVGTDL